VNAFQEKSFQLFQTTKTTERLKSIVLVIHMKKNKKTPINTGVINKMVGVMSEELNFQVITYF